MELKRDFIFHEAMVFIINQNKIMSKNVFEKSVFP